MIEDTPPGGEISYDKIGSIIGNQSETRYEFSIDLLKVWRWFKKKREEKYNDIHITNNDGATIDNNDYIRTD